MELRRFYVQPNYIEGDTIVVKGNEYRHMTDVLRFKVGYKAIVADNSGYDYYATVSAIDKDKVVLHVDEKRLNTAELNYPLTLCFGLIKPEKMEFEVQKAVEIGVRYLQPFISRNTSETGIRQDRLQRIVLEACKQCGRAVLPEVLPLVRFEEMFQKDTQYYFAYEKENKSLLRDVIYRTAVSQKVAIIVGSEGGFTSEEADFAKGQGAIAFSLGKRILRAETAATVALGTYTALTEEL